ncbi:hypothetical protein BKA70DRAFT_1242304 [Coprinopsis sp. MPI-PUGE-AT-0042]|nr:hypothetical protein BKA70DRAFT_1242304 [Coprinopsis sp. MPI-PUGE-AT-0042]
MSSRSLPTQSKLPPSFLDKVAAGSVTASTTFGEKFKDEHYSIDVLNAILSIFQIDPCSSSLSRSEWAFRGFEGLECLEQALTASLLHPHLLGQTRLRMRACMDDVLAWMDSSIQTCYQDLLLDPSAFQRHLASNASAVVACLALKGAFLDKFVQHPVLITTLLTLWPSILVKNAAEAIFKVEEAGTSAILSAFKTAVGHESGFHAIAALLVYNPIKLELFSLCKARYLGFWMKTLVMMAPVFPSNTLLRAVARILDQRLQQGANPIRNLQSIFDHGYLPVLSYALIRYDLSLPPNVANAQNAILSLDAYTYHPRVVMSLLNAFDRLALVLSPEQMEALENLPVLSPGQH